MGDRNDSYLKRKGKYIYKKITQKIGFSKLMSIVKKTICTEVIFHYLGDSTPISFQLH